MFLFIVLAVIQASLLIPIVFICARYWGEDDPKEGGIRLTLFNYICFMSGVELLMWIISQFTLLSATNGVIAGLEVEATTLAINVLFLLSIVLAVFNEIRLRRAS